MARPKRDNDLAARVLVDAALLGDRKACERHKITDRTLRNYRAALDDDPELSAKYSELSRTATTQTWVDELNTTLAVGVRKIRSLIEQTKDPRQLATVTESVKSLAEISITKEVLNAGAAEQGAGDAQAGREDQAPAHLPN